MDFETLKLRLLASVRTRVQNGELTERGLARMVGISQPHMHHILKGVRALSIENADRILRRLDLTVLDLIEGRVPLAQMPEMAEAVAGIAGNEEMDFRQLGEPGVRVQEVF